MWVNQLEDKNSARRQQLANKNSESPARRFELEAARLEAERLEAERLKAARRLEREAGLSENQKGKLRELEEP